MSVPHESASSVARAGERWSDGDYTTLVELVRNGVVLDDVALALGRSTDAIRFQLRNLVPVGANLRSVDVELWLREQYGVEVDCGDMGVAGETSFDEFDSDHAAEFLITRSMGTKTRSMTVRWHQLQDLSDAQRKRELPVLGD